MEKLLKTNSQGVGIVGGLEKSGKFNSQGGGVGILLFLSFLLSHLKILEVLKRFVCYYIFSRLGLFLKFNKRRVWNKNVLG